MVNNAFCPVFVLLTIVSSLQHCRKEVDNVGVILLAAPIRRRALAFVASIAVALAVTACASSQPAAVPPATTGTAVSATAAPKAATTAVPVVTAPAVAASAAPTVPTTAGSGDPVLDAVGSDIDALDQEVAGLDSAATQSPSK